MSSSRPDGARQSRYQVIAEDLRLSILRNDYADGKRIPTEAELSRQYKVSRQTVRRALQELVASGMIYRVPGRGTFPTRIAGEYVRQFNSVEDLNDLSEQTVLSVTRPLTRMVDPAAASRLGSETDVVWVVGFQRLHNNAPFCVTTVYLPPDVGALIKSVSDADDASKGPARTAPIVTMLDAHLERPIAEMEQSISVSQVPAEAAGPLGCAAGEAVLRIDRVYYDTDRRPVELAVSYFHPQSYSYRARFRRASVGNGQSRGTRAQIASA